MPYCMHCIPNTATQILHTIVSLINVESTFIVFEDFLPIPRLLAYYWLWVCSKTTLHVHWFYAFFTHSLLIRASTFIRKVWEGRMMLYVLLHPGAPECKKNGGYKPKGQLISKENFKVSIWTKKWTKIFLYFCPSL